MAWSTRELGELAGTTRRTVRHYQQLGLLDAPERGTNGYQQYGGRHLVQLLRVRRLTELGVPLSRIEECTTPGERTLTTLRALDAELAATMEQLRQARTDIAAILREDAPADTPAGFAGVASQLSESDRSIIHLCAQLYEEDTLVDLRRMVEVDADAGAVGQEIDALPADADPATRQRLAARLAPSVAANLLAYPWLTDPVSRTSRNKRITRQTISEAITALYNPAQLDVLVRAGDLAEEQLRSDPTGADDPLASVVSGPSSGVSEAAAP